MIMERSAFFFFCAAVVVVGLGLFMWSFDRTADLPMLTPP